MDWCALSRRFNARLGGDRRHMVCTRLYRWLPWSYPAVLVVDVAFAVLWSDGHCRRMSEHDPD